MERNLSLLMLVSRYCLVTIQINLCIKTFSIENSWTEKGNVTISHSRIKQETCIAYLHASVFWSNITEAFAIKFLQFLAASILHRFRSDQKVEIQFSLILKNRFQKTGSTHPSKELTLARIQTGDHMKDCGWLYSLVIPKEENEKNLKIEK